MKRTAYLLILTAMFVASTLISASGQNTIFKYVEHQPRFQGNLNEWLGSKLEYPPFAQNNGIEGRPVIQFVVNESGDIQDVSVSKSSYPLLDKEAMRVVSMMPKWDPGTNGGQPVKCYFTIPIQFSMDDKYYNRTSPILDSCNYAFTGPRSGSYTTYPSYNGDYGELEKLTIAANKIDYPTSAHLLVTITKKGIIKTPVLLCNSDEEFKKQVLAAFEKKMAQQNSQHKWSPSTKNYIPTDGTMILSMQITKIQ